MDSNKDEATRCIEIAVTALTEGKISRAEKFLKKAEKLYPSQRAKGKSIVSYLIYYELYSYRSS